MEPYNNLETLLFAKFQAEELDFLEDLIIKILYQEFWGKFLLWLLP